MSHLQKWLLILAALIASLGILLSGLKSRYVWVPGQNDMHGVDYTPKVLDTWTGKSEFAVES